MPNLTDLGNAERFVARHGDRVRWCRMLGEWFAWDGRRWAADRDGAVQRLGVEVVRSLYGEAKAQASADDRKKLADHAMRSESQHRVMAMLELAKALRPVAAVPEDFDGPETEHLLNVENGTLNLWSGELHAHQPADLITRLAPVAFDPEARSAVWEAFLDRMVPDPDVRAFIQRAAGYSLSAATSEEALFFVHGPTAAGKSTFVETIKNMLGEYARTADFESFLKRRGDAGVRDDVARLAGARMVVSLEVDEGRSLAEGLVKSLTGGDTIAARHLYGRFFEFRPAFKLWLVANTCPAANAQDTALWRRIHLVPFTVSLAEADRSPAVKMALTQDPGVRAAVLAWAAQGCARWRKAGLGAPEAVRRATDIYRATSDHLGAFLAECYETTSDIEEPAKRMREKYEKWCEENGERPKAQKHLAGALERLGWHRGKSDGVRLWRWDVGTSRDVSSSNSALYSAREGNSQEATSLGVPTSREGGDA